MSGQKYNKWHTCVCAMDTVTGKETHQTDVPDERHRHVARVAHVTHVTHVTHIRYPLLHKMKHL